MADRAEIARYEERKRLLVMESQVLRERLVSDLAPLQHTVAQAERVYAWWQILRPFWPLAAGLFGFAAARGQGGWLRSAGKLWDWWKLIHEMLGFFRSRKESGPAEPAPPPGRN